MTLLITSETGLKNTEVSNFEVMKREIKTFKSFAEQEQYFLEYFMNLTPSERLKSLAELQKKNYKDFTKPAAKLLTVRKHYFANGH